MIQRFKYIKMHRDVAEQKVPGLLEVGDRMRRYSTVVWDGENVEKYREW